MYPYNISLAAALGAAFMTTSATAGGFDRGGVNIDQLFDEKSGVKTTQTFVAPQRDLRNIVRGVNAVNGISPPGAPVLPVATTGKISPNLNYHIPSIGYKANITDQFSCLASYNEPYGIDADYGTGNAYSATTVRFEVKSQDVGLTCGYRFGVGETSLGQSYMRVIAGGSYQRLEGFQERQSFLDLATAGIGAVGLVTNTSGLGNFDVDGEEFGYRVGLSYEIPSIALRAAVIYNSEINHNLQGGQSSLGFGVSGPTAIVPVSVAATIPQSIDVRLQSGINAKTLAFLNFRWQQWSELGILPIVGGINPATGAQTALSFDPLYQDGYTVTAGIGRALTEDLSGLISLGWDRGTSTISGFQSDTWNLAGGVSYKVDEDVELQLGGLIGLLTSGRSGPSGGDAANNVSYSYDSDIVYAVSASFKVKF